MRGRLFSITIALAFVVFVISGTAACSDSDSPVEPELSLSATNGTDFTGSWSLNADASDLPPRDDREDNGDRPPPSPNDQNVRDKEGKGHQEGFGPNGPPPNQPGGPGQEGMQGRHPKPPGPMASMSITHTDTGITVNDGRRDHTIFTDGRTETVTHPDGSEMEITAGWDDDTLVIQRSADNGRSATERWSLNGSGQLEISIESDRPPMTLVYDLVS